MTIDTVDDARAREFQRGFGGEIVRPSDATYDETRRLWNAVHDRRPALIAQPRTNADVAAAIRFARDHDLALAVRAGGHSPAGHSTCDGGLVIDLSLMRGVSVDPATRTAVANGGAFLGELDVAGQEYGLVCPVGVIGHTGVAGLTLGGGVGRLQRNFGLTIDSLRAVELVTADGRFVRASENEEPELFWGMRGAGWNFGIVTAFEFALHPFGPDLHRGVRVYPATAAHEVWEVFEDYAAGAPDAVSMIYGIAPASEVDGGRPAGQRVAIRSSSSRSTTAVTPTMSNVTRPGCVAARSRSRSVAAAPLSGGPDGPRPCLRRRPALVHQGPVCGRVPAVGARCARRARGRRAS